MNELFGKVLKLIQDKGLPFDFVVYPDRIHMIVADKGRDVYYDVRIAPDGITVSVHSITGRKEGSQ